MPVKTDTELDMPSGEGNGTQATAVWGHDAQATERVCAECYGSVEKGVSHCVWERSRWC